jgi:hypothetical protein
MDDKTGYLELYYATHLLLDLDGTDPHLPPHPEPTTVQKGAGCKV